MDIQRSISETRDITHKKEMIIAETSNVRSCLTYLSIFFATSVASQDLLDKQ